MLALQDMSDTVCHGVDTLNSETQEVTTFVLARLTYIFFNVHFALGPYS